MTEESQEFLTFILDDEEYGVNILSVQEIRVCSITTSVPNTPDYIKGVINLRGLIIPIVDLRKRFNKKSTESRSDNVFIILKSQFRGKYTTIGIFVDGVSDVFSLQKDTIQPSPDFGKDIDVKFISGMATVDERIIILLDTEKLLNTREIYQLSNELNDLAS